MKRYCKYRIVVLLLAMLACVCLFAACGNPVQSLVLSGEPQTVFVRGNDVDLSGGTLTVNGKKGSFEIGFDDPEVEISGYDGESLGKQEITISYRGAKTTLEVTVVSRIAADNNCVKSYFVGEDFDRTKGKFVVTEDDGSSFSVPAGDPSIEILSFDSSRAGKAPVEARWQSGEKSYVGSFDVVVYDVGDMTLTKPSKTAYKSHETELDLAGGYLTLTASDGALTKYVALTGEMISGFDTGAASLENRTQPLMQTVVVTYRGEEKSFDISITYSDVSVIKAYAAEFSALFGEGEGIPVITEEQGERAREAIGMYTRLSSADREAWFSGEELDATARAAAVYVCGEWTERALSFGKTLQFSYDAASGKASVSPIAESYEAAKADLGRLTAEEPDEIYALCDLISDIKTLFGDVSVGESDLSAYLSIVCSSADLKHAAELLARTIDAYESLLPVPGEWSASGLDAYKSAIAESASDVVTLSVAAGSETRAYCYLISVWRKDFFDILYNYYYATEGGDSAMIAKLGRIYLPYDLEELYYELFCAWKELNGLYTDLYGSSEYIYFYDTTDFMYRYDAAVKLAKEINESGDELNIYLMNNIRFDWFEYSNVAFASILYTLRVATCGYLYYMAPMYGNAAFTALWEKYIGVVDMYLRGSGSGEAFTQEVKELFGGFVGMTPTEQYAFLCSVNPYYKSGVPVYALETGSGFAYSYFAAFVADVYGAELDGDAFDVFEMLLCAMEDYINSPFDEYNLGVFLENMSGVNAAYAALSEAERASFDGCAGEVYRKYLAIYDRYDENGNLKAPAQPGEWQEAFDELRDAVADAEYMYVYLVWMYENYGQKPVYSVFLASYERVEALSEYILANAPSEILDVYYTEYAFEPYGLDCAYTWEYAVYYIHKIYMDILTEHTTGGLIWLDGYEIYATDGLREFMEKAAVIMINYQTLSENFGKNDVIEAERAFRGLTVYTQYYFYSLENTHDYYWNGLEMYYSDVLSGEAAAAANLLSLVEKYYMYYGCYLGTNYEASARALLVQAWAEFRESYEGLSADDKLQFDDLLSEKAAYYAEAVAEASAA